MKKGIIELAGMEFYAYHGCYETERKVGNRFIVDVSIEADIEAAAAADDVAATVNYLEVYETVRAEMEITSSIIESVAVRILSSLRRAFPDAGKITVKLSKLSPPLGGKVDRASVTVSC